MKRILLFALPFIAFNCFSQVPAIEWQKTFGGTGGDAGRSIVQTDDGGYAIAGFSYSNDLDITNNHGQNDLWLIKLDASGTIQWQKAIGGTAFDSEGYLTQTQDGGFVIGGISNSNDFDAVGNHGDWDILVAKTDASGNLQWSKSLGGSGQDFIGDVIQTSDGGFAVGGNTRSNNGDVTSNHGSSDQWLVKLSAAGAIEWQKTYGGTGQDFIASLAQTPDGGFITGGSTMSNNGDVTSNMGSHDIWVTKLDSTGAIQWQSTYGGTASDYCDKILITDGGYILSGATYSNNGMVSGNHGGCDVWVVALDSAGALLWQKTFGGTGTEDLTSIAATEGGYIITSSSTSANGDLASSHGSYDCWFFKIDNAGTLLWQDNFGGSQLEVPYQVLATDDGGFAFVAETGSSDVDITSNHGASDIWFVKFAFDALATRDFSASLSFYPNPANNTLYVQSRDGITIDKVNIYDISGQHVSTGNMVENTIDIENLSPGTFIIRAFSGEAALTAKFIKI